MTFVLIKEETCRDTRRSPGEDIGRDCIDAVECCQQPLGGRHGTYSPSELPEEASLPKPRFWTSGLQNWKTTNFWGFPGSSDGKESACNAGEPGSVPGWGRSPGEGNGYPLQYCCLENPMDKGAWWASDPGVTKSDMTEWLTLFGKLRTPNRG